MESADLDKATPVAIRSPDLDFDDFQDLMGFFLIQRYICCTIFMKIPSVVLREVADSQKDMQLEKRRIRHNKLLGKGNFRDT